VYPSSSGPYPLDLSGLDGPTSSYATAGIALRVSGALKAHHQDKVGTASVGIASVGIASLGIASVGIALVGIASVGIASVGIASVVIASHYRSNKRKKKTICTSQNYYFCFLGACKVNRPNFMVDAGLGKRRDAGEMSAKFAEPSILRKSFRLS
jgi:hypothetical protein